MPKPSLQDVHVDAPLTNISVAFMQEARHYIANQVFPSIPVDKQSDKYFVYDREDWYRDDAQQRGPGAESAGGGYKQSTDSYSTVVYAFHKDVPDQIMLNSDAPLDALRDATRYVTQIMLNRLERQWVTDFFATSIWTTDVVGGTDFTLWSNAAASDPIGDIETGKEAVLKDTGFEPNTLVCGYQAWRILKHHPDLVDRFKHTSAASLTPEMVAGVFELDRVLVSKSIKNTANENLTGSYDFTAGKNALLCYVTPTPGIMVPSAGYSFVWRGISEGLGASVAVRRFRLERNRAERVEAEAGWDNKVVSADLGYFFSAAVA